MTRKARSVSEVARLAGVSVRTLHHYDEIGLLVPSARSQNGYRRYAEDDVRRLLAIAALKALELPLETIQRLLDDPALDRLEALEEQKKALLASIAEKQAALRAIDAAIAAERTRSTTMSDDIFGDSDKHAAYEAEAKERWGHTDAYKESVARAKHYTKDDWASIKAERESLTARLAELMAEGRAPGDELVADVVEEHRAHLERWFYPCSREMHGGLGRMYRDDPRFAVHFEALRPGLAAFVCAAFEAHADSSP